MPKIERWENFPEGVRQHLIDRMRDRAISIADLNQLRLWVETKPEVPREQLVQGLRIIQDLRPRSWPRRFCSVVKRRRAKSSPELRNRLDERYYQKHEDRDSRSVDNGWPVRTDGQ